MKHLFIDNEVGRDFVPVLKQIMEDYDKLQLKRFIVVSPIVLHPNWQKRLKDLEVEYTLISDPSKISEKGGFDDSCIIYDSYKHFSDKQRAIIDKQFWKYDNNLIVFNELIEMIKG